MMDIIYFDGDCLFCNRSIQLIIKLDRNQRFYFALLRSDYAKKHLNSDLIKKVDSIIYQTPARIYTKSSAVIRIISHLGIGYRFLLIFLLIPVFIRNFFYDLFARYRYQLFGRQDQCTLPSAHSSRFLV